MDFLLRDLSFVADSFAFSIYLLHIFFSDILKVIVIFFPIFLSHNTLFLSTLCLDVTATPLTALLILYHSYMGNLFKILYIRCASIYQCEDYKRRHHFSDQSKLKILPTFFYISLISWFYANISSKSFSLCSIPMLYWCDHNFRFIRISPCFLTNTIAILLCCFIQLYSRQPLYLYVYTHPYFRFPFRLNVSLCGIACL